MAQGPRHLETPKPRLVLCSVSRLSIWALGEVPLFLVLLDISVGTLETLLRKVGLDVPVPVLPEGPVSLQIQTVDFLCVLN